MSKYTLDAMEETKNIEIEFTNKGEHVTTITMILNAGVEFGYREFVDKMQGSLLSGQSLYDEKRKLVATATQDNALQKIEQYFNSDIAYKNYVLRLFDILIKEINLFFQSK